MIKSIILFIHLYLLRKNPDCCIDVCNKLKNIFLGVFAYGGAVYFIPTAPAPDGGVFAAYRRHRLLAAYPQYQFVVWQVNPKTG